MRWKVPEINNSCFTLDAALRGQNLGLSSCVLSGSSDWPSGGSARDQVSLFFVQSLGPVRPSVTPWTAARRASPSSTVSQSSLKLMSLDLVMLTITLLNNDPLLQV